MYAIRSYYGKAAEELHLEAATIALNGGEDYELLFTVPLADFEKVSALDEITILGHMENTSNGNYLVMPDGSLVELTSMGWNSFVEE